MKEREPTHRHITYRASGKEDRQTDTDRHATTVATHAGLSFAIASQQEPASAGFADGETSSTSSKKADAPVVVADDKAGARAQGAEATKQATCQ